MAKITRTSEEKKDIGISTANRKKISAHLNELLADETVFYLKTRKFHWNIVGPQFHDLHLFLENQYTILEKVIDGIAERIRKMGYYANGSMKQYLTDTNLKENTNSDAITIDMLQELLSDLNYLIKSIRSLIDIFEDEYNDVGGADFLTGLMEQHEKSAWMIRSILG